MKKLYTIVLIGFGLFMAACTYNHRLEQTLQKAGSNRAELEKVLVHYKNDKKKNEATRFLLENMAECHTTVAPLIDSLKVLKRIMFCPWLFFPHLESHINVFYQILSGDDFRIIYLLGLSV